MEAAESTSSSRTGMILVVEDDPLVASSVKGVLEDEGYEAEIAGSVAEANARFLARAPALILLDWNLPDGSGEDVVRAVRPRDASVPIVVMSAQREAIVDSYAVEARERLSKPFDLERLLALVRRYLG